MKRTSPSKPSRIACVRVPNLLLQARLRERFRAADRPHVAAALLSSQAALHSEGQEKIVAVNEVAIECGVRPGASLAAARGACPELVTFIASPEHAEGALASLADALGRFGPLVSISAPDTVFIDTTGVLARTKPADDRRHQYGIDVSVPALLEVVEELGFNGAASIATNPFIARALVSDTAIQRSDLTPSPTPSQEKREVERLSLRAVGLPPQAFQALDLVGIRTVGAFMALPGASIARRFGQAVYTLWRQANGLERAPLAPYVPKEIIREVNQSDESMHELEPLCFCIKNLIDRALSRLHGRGQGIESLALDFTLDTAYDNPHAEPEQLVLLDGSHVTHKPHSHIHRLTLSLGHPKQDAAMLLQLVRSRLKQRPPQGPVLAIALEVEQTALLQPRQLELFGAPEPAETIQTTVARLAAALGNAHFTPALCEDYRPERAWEMIAMGRKTSLAAPPPGPRPTRLLKTPTRLEYPIRQREPPGALVGPERLVTGWWDSEPIARDYWVIADRWGRRSWVFRDLSSSQWFLHGHFD